MPRKKRHEKKKGKSLYRATKRLCQLFPKEGFLTRLFVNHGLRTDSVFAKILNDRNLETVCRDVLSQLKAAKKLQVEGVDFDASVPCSDELKATLKEAVDLIFTDYFFDEEKEDGELSETDERTDERFDEERDVGHDG